MSFKSPVKLICLEKKKSIKSRFIVFKTTAQIIPTQPQKKWKKCRGAGKLSKNCKNITFWQFWGILSVFSLISRPPFWLSLCDLWGHFEYNKPSFYGKLFLKNNHIRLDLKNMFCHFSKRRWTLEIIFLVKVSYFCDIHLKLYGKIHFKTFYLFTPPELIYNLTYLFVETWEL